MQRSHYFKFAMGLCVFVLLAVAISGRTVLATETVNTDWPDASTRKAVARNIRAVVHVEAIRQQAVADPETDLADASFIKTLLDSITMSGTVEQALKRLGTGMIIDSKGHVITNSHVVSGATAILVSLANGRQYRAKPIGTDRTTDIAVIQILTRDPLPHVVFGNSDSVKNGQQVTALAHLHPQNPTIGRGTILGENSGNARTSMDFNAYFKKSPVVNLGFSGGPLLNADGEVIGVNAAIMSSSHGLEGLAFSIPGNVAIDIASRLISGQKPGINRPGARGECLRSALARSLSMTQLQAMLICSRGLASSIACSDVGKPGTAFHEKGSMLEANSTTRAISKDRQRGSDRLETSGKDQAPTLTGGNSIKNCLGLVARPATAEEIRRYHLRLGQTVVVTWLDPTGPLARAGVEVDDMMLEINGRRIGGLDHLAQLVSCTRPRKRITILVLDHRTGRAGYIQVRSP